MTPLVLVQSYGKKSCADIIKEILKSNGDEFDVTVQKFKEQEIETYKLNIITKYFKTQISLFVCEDFNKIRPDLLPLVEGCIFYFDPDNESFCADVAPLNKFMADNNIDTSCFITNNVSENLLIYNLTKQFKLSIIDLNEQWDDEHCGYQEVLQILRNKVWSSVDLSDIRCEKETNNALDNDLKEEYCNVEQQLNEFEDLVNSIQTFKTLSQNLSRDDVLNNAEILAEQFVKMLSED
ncbi:uncharacterized protein LOC106092072 [Stomoxys calcitrans]|uniref:uncharacterized protein LOC106092072 n=1 Tax=Stomoxys calcitrans TaxID=35570 RepID=UPI0027E2F423|nr:uncharacterized protein LOC106092072 [Stomoxys calcitrans]